MKNSYDQWTDDELKTAYAIQCLVDGYKADLIFEELERRKLKTKQLTISEVYGDIEIS